MDLVGLDELGGLPFAQAGGQLICLLRHRSTHVRTLRQHFGREIRIMVGMGSEVFGSAARAAGNHRRGWAASLWQAVRQISFERTAATPLGSASRRIA